MPDVVVIGAGINGLVAAAELAAAGRSVTLLERSPQLGGFIASGERTVPGFVHDTFSSWHPLFVSGGAYAALGDALHARGLVYANTDGAVTASVHHGPDGDPRTAIAHRDPAATAAALTDPHDSDAYLAMLQQLDARAGTVFGAFGAEPRSAAGVRLLVGALRSGRLRGTEELIREAATSGRSWVRRAFRGWEVDALWSPWLLHAGLGPDHASGGLMIPVLAGTLHGFGMPVVTGGAGRFVAAFSSLLEDSGVTVLTGTEVDGIVVEGGRATGVRAAGRVIRADTVLAGTSPQALYGRLLPPAAVDTAITADAARYRNGRAAMQIHLALDGPVPWSDGRLAQVPLVHVTDGSGSTGIACAQAEAGLLPSAPTVVVGQQCVLDPSRAPAGRSPLWIQLQELPFSPVGDAAGEWDVAGGWSTALLEGYADRVIDRIEQHAPGLRAKVLGRDLIGPEDLLQANVNAVNGDPYGGSAELDQNLLWRPFPSAAHHRTAVDGLWHIGASTHPGPGLAGGSGHLVAQQLLKTDHRRRTMHRLTGGLLGRS